MIDALSWTFDCLLPYDWKFAIATILSMSVAPLLSIMAIRIAGYFLLGRFVQCKQNDFHPDRSQLQNLREKNRPVVLSQATGAHLLISGSAPHSPSVRPQSIQASPVLVRPAWKLDRRQLSPVA